MNGTWADPEATWADVTVSWTGVMVVQHSYAEGFTGDEGPPTTWHRIVNFAEGGAHRGSEQYYY